MRRHRLIDDRDRLGVIHIGFREPPSTGHLHLESSQQVLATTVKSSSFRMRRAGHNGFIPPSCVITRQRIVHRYFSHVRQRLQSLTNLFPIVLLELPDVPGPTRKPRREKEKVLLVESQVDMRQFVEAPNHQPRASQQHHRKRHFRDHQPGAESPMPEASARALAASSQHRLQIARYRAHRRRQSRKKRRQCRNGQQETQNRRIQTNDRLPSDSLSLVRNRRGYKFQSEIRKHAARRARSRRQHGTLDEELPHQSPARRAKRGPQRNLFFPRPASRQEQIRNSAARNQNQQHHACPEVVQHVLDVEVFGLRPARAPDFPRSHQKIRRRLYSRREMFWKIPGFVFRQTLHDHVQLRRRRRNTYTRLQPRHEHADVRLIPASCCVRRVRDRNPQLLGRAICLESLQHYTRQGARLTVQKKTLAENLRV